VLVADPEEVAAEVEAASREDPGGAGGAGDAAEHEAGSCRVEVDEHEAVLDQRAPDLEVHAAPGQVVALVRVEQQPVGRQERAQAAPARGPDACQGAPELIASGAAKLTA
jgi:hypothetical protein